MLPLRRSATLKQGELEKITNNSSSAITISISDPFGDANSIPKKVSTVFPQLDVSKLKIRTRWNSIITAILNVLIILLLYKENEEFNSNQHKSNISENLLRIFIIFLSAISISLVIQYWSIKLYQKKAYRECHVSSGFWEYPKIRNWMLLEIIFCCINVPPYCDWTFTFKQLNTSSIMSADDIIVSLSFIRLYFVFKMMYECSTYSSRRAEYVCNMENVKDIMAFSLKSILTIQTYFSILFLLALLMISGGALLRIFERSISNTKFDYIWNGFFTVAATALTIGYGDSVPTTHLGRFICVIASIFGIFSVSYTVWAVQNSIAFNHSEFQIYDAMVFKKNIKKKLEPIASILLQRWWILLQKRKQSQPRLQVLNEFYCQFYRFKLLKNQMKGDVNKTLSENINDFASKLNICMPKIFNHLEPGQKVLEIAVEMTNNQLFIAEKLKRIQNGTRSLKKQIGEITNSSINDYAHRRYSDKTGKRATLVEMKKAQCRALKKLMNRRTSDSSINSELSSPRFRADSIADSDAASDQ
ncbi:unnamed protein product [Blepharisma stoltei]|uniref:Potassium channel domain-containing protein n=1 Tax=Blepharisma stoltei TaxID=1481888 RepID=A0AAU9JUX4_9CILI|nr:unnamed protein product [Blepharisma stoltei]